MRHFPVQLILFVGLTQFFAWLGIYLKQLRGIQGAELVFLGSPFVLALLFGFRDPDINFEQSLRSLSFKRAWRWYLFALLVYPLAYLLLTWVGEMTGLVTTGGWQRLPSLVLFALPSALLFAVFEEVAWRGYLEPLFAVRGYSQASASLVVGVIWASWHLPQFVYGYFEVYRATPLLSFALFTLTLLVTAQVYGVMRRRSGVVWTSVLTHGIANAVLFPLLISEGAVWTSYRAGWLVLPTPASLSSLVFWCVVWQVIRFVMRNRVQA